MAVMQMVVPKFVSRFLLFGYFTISLLMRVLVIKTIIIIDCFLSAKTLLLVR